MAAGEYGVGFIAAKSRVASLKKLTIPGLELQGAVVFDILNIQLESEAVRTKTIETRGN